MDDNPSEWLASIAELDTELRARTPALASMREAIEIPNAEAILCLVTSLRRVVESVGWLPLAAEVEWLDLSWLRETERLLRAVELDSDHEWQTESLGNLWGHTEVYPLYACLIDPSRKRTKGLDQLRAAAVLCRIHWLRNAMDKDSVMSLFCSAIREASRKPSGPVAKVFGEFKDAQSPQELASKGDVLARIAHEGMARAWKNHIRDALQKIISTRRPPVPGGPDAPDIDGLPPPGTPGPTTGGPSLGGSDGPKTDSPEGKVRPKALSGQLRIPARDERDIADPAEATLSVDALEVTAQRGDFATLKLAIFRALQTTWNNNALLLPTHGRVMPEQDLRELCRFLSQQLHQEWRKEDADLVTGLLGLLLQAITGRTASHLMAVTCRRSPHEVPSPADCQLDLVAGVIRMPALQIKDAFSPTPSQVPLLEEIGGGFDLPLPARLLEGLRRQMAAGFSLIAGNEQAQGELIRRAAGFAEANLGIPVWPGEVRRAFPCYLYEHARDLVVVMHTCGDPLGLSAAPTFYYAPRRLEVARKYVATVCDLFGESVPNLDADAFVGRAGARLLVRPRTARELANCFGRLAHRGRPQRDDVAGIAELHMGLVDQLAGMLLAIVGHRPVDALFRLRLSHFDLLSGCALFSDKQLDFAHFHRLVGIPRIVSRQILEYLSHLAALIEILPKDSPIRARAEQALSGSGPLLFAANADGRAGELTLQDWKQRLPESWLALPLNWGRTYVRTHCTDWGVRPELLAMQLGHLEMAGYPFSMASPTVPMDFVDAVNPFLERLAKETGWKVRSGLRPKVDVSSSLPSLPPLCSWTSALSSHRALMREKRREAGQHLRAASRDYRECGTAKAIAILKQCLPELGRMAEMVAAAPKTQWPATPPDALRQLDVEDIAKLQSAIRSGCEDDFALWIATSNAVARLVRRVNKRYRIEGELPPRWRLIHRPMDCPFVDDNLIAKRQIDAIRTHLIEASGSKRVASEDAAIAFARTALILVVFGYCHDEKEVLAILDARGAARRSARLKDLVLVPHSSDGKQVTGLRGLAALALLSLASRLPKANLPEPAALETALMNLLPKGLTKDSRGLLAQLCETAGIAFRVELSPAARMALDPSGGCRSAAIEDQLALIDGDPVGSICHPKPESQEDVSPDSVMVPVAAMTTGLLRVDYRSLLTLLPNGKKPTVLPRTRKTIPAASANTRPAREQVIAELDALLRDGTVHPTARMLGFWTRDMLVHGTPLKTDPANSTVRTYVSHVGSFMSVATDVSLAVLEDVELEQLYQDIVQSKDNDADRAVAAREILHFHARVAPAYGLAAIDDAPLCAWIGTAERSADAQLVLPQERDLAVLTAISSAGFDASHGEHESIGDQRHNRDATALLAMTGYTGARVGELLGSLLRDLRVASDRPLLRIVANRNRRVKTNSARRYAALSPAMPAQARRYLAQWHTAWVSRQAKHLRERSFAFATFGTHNDLATKDAIRDKGAEILGLATGRGRDKLHRLRHLAGFEALTQGVLCDADQEALREVLPHLGKVKLDIALPRDLHRRTVPLGHHDPSITFRSYFHFPWMARSRSDDRMRRFLDSWGIRRRGAALALNASSGAGDRVRQRKKADTSLASWMDHVCPPRRVPEAPVKPDSVNRKGLSVLKVVDIAALCGLVERSGSPEQAGMALGASRDDMRVLQRASEAFQHRAGKALWHLDTSHAGLTQAPALRMLASLRSLDSFWDVIDADPDSRQSRTLIAITQACYAHLAPSRGKELVLPSDEAAMLERLLRSLGLEVFASPSPTVPDVTVLTVIRPGERRSVRYAGNGIRRVLGIIHLWLRHRTARQASSYD